MATKTEIDSLLPIGGPRSSRLPWVAFEKAPPRHVLRDNSTTRAALSKHGRFDPKTVAWQTRDQLLSPVKPAVDLRFENKRIVNICQTAQRTSRGKKPRITRQITPVSAPQDKPYQLQRL
jgi:hypothetical protein